VQLSSKTLEKLREIINGDGTPDYRSGSALVKFFNELGFRDVYGQGFPSRWVYTDEKLQKINGTPELDKCIKNTFAVVNYIGRVSDLDSLIDGFNRYLAFDKWAVKRDNDIISFKKLDRVIIDEMSPKTTEDKEQEFLKRTFEIDVDALKLDTNVTEIIKSRLHEVEICVSNGAALSATIMIGSILEGILLGVASSFPQLFNRANSAPKEKDGKQVRKFHEWTLNNYIDVAFEIGILKHDVKQFSYSVRDFRNYIHPYQQMATQFSPDKQTALICFQVLKAAIYQIGEFRKANNGGKING
jgi:hypothetical protein